MATVFVYCPGIVCETTDNPSVVSNSRDPIDGLQAPPCETL